MEEKQHSIKENYIYSLLFQILTIIVPLITTPYLSRVLEADGVGIFSLTITNVSYFTLIGVLGLGTYGQLEIAKVKDDIEKRSKLFFEIMLTRGCMHVICIIAYIVFILVSEKYKTMYMLQGILIIASMLDLTWYFQGLEEFKRIAIRNIIIKIFSVALIFLLVKQKSDLYVYTAILSVSTLLCNICFYPTIGKYVKHIDFRTLAIRKHIKGSLVFFLPTIASVIMTSLDKTMIGAITRSEAENGYYAQAYKIETLCMSLFSSLNLVMRSRMAYMFHNSQKNETAEMLGKSLRFVSLLAFPIAFGTIAITHNFVPWFFGDGYDKVTVLLPIFAIWLIFKSHSNCILEQYLTSSGRQNIATGIIWAAAILNIILNAVLIRLYQSVGAAVASMCAELLVLILALIAGRKVITLRTIITNMWKYLISAGIMCVATIFVGRLFLPGILSTFIQIGVGGALYCVLLFLLKDSYLIQIIRKKF